MVTLQRWLALAAAAILVWFALDLILLLFAGVLLAIFLRTLSEWVSSRLRVPQGAGLLIVMVVLLGAVGITGALYAPTIAEQGDELATELPRVVSDLGSRVREYSWGSWLMGELSNSAPEGQEVVQRASRAAGTLMHALTAIAVVIFVGLYLAAEPRPYVRGLVRLFSLGQRRRVAEALYATLHVLRAWLFGQAIAMVIVGAAMGIGLSIIGVRLSFILGVLAGIFEFVPVLGPVIALVPALMLAAAEGGQQALYVLVLYGIVQTAESYVITPLVQRRAAELPPVVTIVAQLALGWMAGPIGLLVAVPLMAAAMVLVQLLYVTDVLKDRIDPELEKNARQDVNAAASGTLKGVLPREG